jgi:hypothetical protein
MKVRDRVGQLFERSRDENLAMQISPSIFVCDGVRHASTRMAGGGGGSSSVRRWRG